jgi:multidrug efflux pump subunit AcrB
MLYMSSQATTDGLMTLTVTFKLGTDPDKAQQLVQNRVSRPSRACRRKCAASASPRSRARPT